MTASETGHTINVTGKSGRTYSGKKKEWKKEKLPLKAASH